MPDPYFLRPYFEFATKFVNLRFICMYCYFVLCEVFLNVYVPVVRLTGIDILKVEINPDNKWALLYRGVQK